MHGHERLRAIDALVSNGPGGAKQQAYRPIRQKDPALLVFCDRLHAKPSCNATMDGQASLRSSRSNAAIMIS